MASGSLPLALTALGSLRDNHRTGKLTLAARLSHTNPTIIDIRVDQN